MTAVRPTYAEARAAVEARLRPESLAHSERVAAVAAKLADAYGADSEAASLAGLLHDWHRDTADEGLLDAAECYGLAVDGVEHSRPYLLHARTAAAEIAEVLPGVGADVIEAVGAHTLGAVGMSDLAKIVYVADMTEPARTWEGVEELRSAAGRVDLDELFVRAYERTLAHVVAKRKPIHPRALEVWNSVVGQGRP